MPCLSSPRQIGQVSGVKIAYLQRKRYFTDALEDPKSHLQAHENLTDKSAAK